MKNGEIRSFHESTRLRKRLAVSVKSKTCEIWLGEILLVHTFPYSSYLHMYSETNAVAGHPRVSGVSACILETGHEINGTFSRLNRDVYDARDYFNLLFNSSSVFFLLSLSLPLSLPRACSSVSFMLSFPFPFLFIFAVAFLYNCAMSRRGKTTFVTRVSKRVSKVNPRVNAR